MKKFYAFMKIHLALLSLLLLGLTELRAQERTVQGKVSSQEDGSALPGVSVLIKGTSTGTVTDATGSYKLSVPSTNTMLVFSFVGFTSEEVVVGNQTTINTQLVSDIKALSEVVVTGYSTQQKKDITGAVAVVKTKDLLSVPAASFTQQLEGRAAGVVVGTSGEPGAGASIRIRGVGSFNNNDPLYVIDGVPVTGAFQNYLNPNDIESLQVLKDASAASIYGSRANNGVVIITTKKGSAGPARITYDTYYGIQSNGSPQLKMLNPTEYADLIFQTYQNAGQTPPSTLWGTGATPRLPDYIVPAGALEGDPRTNPANYTTDIDDPNYNISKFVITKANKTGTDWQKEIYHTAPILNHNLNISGGSDKNRFNLGMNYFDQKGIVKETYFKRYTMRANSEFTVKNNIRVGENLQFNFIDQVNIPGGNQGEGNPITKALQHHSIVPIYDINGNWSANKAPGLGTGQNPYAQLIRNKDNTGRYIQLLGNVFAEATILKNFVARTSFGVQYGVGWRRTFGYRTYEASEPNASNSYSESGDYSTNWTWTNTLTYSKVFGESHSVKILAGAESIRGDGRNINASRNNYFIDDLLYRSLDRGEKNQQNSGNGSTSTLFSLFARADYAYQDKYLLSATIRRDGSSRVGYNNPYGVFPAVSVGWRLSKEGFMENVAWVNDLKVRVGWGRTGNQLIDPANSYSSFGGSPGGTSYDLSGNSNNPVSGFGLNRYGNPDVKWESQTSTNVGLDASLVGGKLDLTLDLYTRKTNDLLYKLPFPSTAGIASTPYVNIGEMQNKGIELGINYNGVIASDFKFNVGLNLTHYKNEILRVGDSDESFFTGGGSRYGDIARSLKGHPMSSFYGYVVDGIFQNAEEVQSAATQPGISKTTPDPFTEYTAADGSKSRGFGIGRFRFKDINGDQVIDEKDQTFIGNPHPKLIYGLNLGLTYKAFDFTMFFQGNYGNKLYFYNRWWTDFNSFQVNRSQQMLNESWRPDRRDARLPLLDVRDAFANGAPHSYYVQDGSYLRAKSVILGYSLPVALVSKAGINKVRFYVQGQNLFTITKYEGQDPAMMQTDPGANDSGIPTSDRAIGIDFGNYPVARTFLVGLNVTF